MFGQETKAAMETDRIAWGDWRGAFSQMEENL